MVGDGDAISIPGDRRDGLGADRDHGGAAGEARRGEEDLGAEPHCGAPTSG